jgi:S1-C subfamily serine protease
MKFRTIVLVLAVVIGPFAGAYLALTDYLPRLNGLQDRVTYCEYRDLENSRRYWSTQDQLNTLQSNLFYNSLQQVSVKVEVGDGAGSGVLVSRKVGSVWKTFVWTAGHVAESLKKSDGTFGNAVIYQETRSFGKFVSVKRTPAKVIAYSEANLEEDLALLEVLEDNFYKGSAWFADESIPAVGTNLIHVGSTLGIYNSVSLGIISQTDRDLLNTGKVFDQTSVMGYPGSSGGGVYRADNGACIGLLVRGAGAGINFIVPIRRMLPWAKANGVEWAINPDAPVPLTRTPTNLEQVPKTPVVEPEVKPMAPGGPKVDRRIQKLI